jgi:formate-dependent nitrite reductase membrane component NrfD
MTVDLSKGSITKTGTEMRSYYGHPVIKEPTWTWEIPCYFFTGGLGGASSVLGFSAKLFGNEKLSRTALYLGAISDAVSAPLLISDLGRPERFHHMLRVFKVTSPMNVGAWVLTVAGGASNTAAVLELLGILKPVKVLAEIVASFFGPPLATYTGVLVADTAIPVWHEGRHELPWLFGASAAASAGAAAALFVEPGEAGPARRLAVAGAVGELVLTQAMETRLGEVGEVYRQGAAGAFGRAAKALSAAGAAVLATRGAESRAAQVLGGALVCAGGMCLRWSVYKAGFQSARDPKYTVKPQRERAHREGTKVTTLPGEKAAPASRGA